MKEVNTDLIERTMVGAIRKVNSWDGTNAPLRWLLYGLQTNENQQNDANKISILL